MEWYRYKLTDEQTEKIARLAYQEQGTEKGARAEASLMANLLEITPKYFADYAWNIYSFVRNSGWFSRAAYWMDNGKAPAAIVRAVSEVLRDGKRTLPLYVNEHDCFSDIKNASNDGRSISIKDRSAYISGKTIIKNRYGSTYTFYCFPDQKSDPFGYIQKWEEPVRVTANDIIKKAEYYIGYEEKKSAKDLDDFHANAGKGNFQKFQPLAGAGNGDEWCQYFVDGVFVEVCGNIRAARERLYMGSSAGAMTGYTPDGKNYFVRAGRWYTTPEPGDVVYFYSTAKKRVGHVGVVTSVDKARKIIRTVEGNTSSTEYSENGGCVARHEYDYSRIGGTNRVNGFGRPNYDAGGWGIMDEGKFIGNTYVDELYRQATEKEIDHWIGEIEKGTTYDGVIAGIRNSEEGMKAWIAMCYWTLLERAPDADGMAAWLKAMKAGKTRAGVLEGFKTSKEYQEKHKKG